MLLAQIDDAVKHFSETAQSYGLAVAVLIAVIAFFIFALVMMARWLKPRFDRLIDSHIITMENFRTNSDAIVKTQVDQSKTLDVITKLQEKTCSTLDSNSGQLAKILVANQETTAAIKSLGCVMQDAETHRKR